MHAMNKTHIKFWLLAASALTIATVPASAAPSLLTLYTFNTHKNGLNRPGGADIALFGRTLIVGTMLGSVGNTGGVVFLRPAHSGAPTVVPWNEKTVWAFGNPNLIGVPYELTVEVNSPTGIFFTVAPGGTSGTGFIMQTDLKDNIPFDSFPAYYFPSASVGPANPQGPLAELAPLDTGGGRFIYNFLGAAAGGSGGTVECGTLYFLTSGATTQPTQPNSWSTSVYHRFSATGVGPDGSSSGPDGCGPNGVVRGPDGTLFGTTYAGGPAGQGTVFSVTPSPSGTGPFTYQTLYSFQVMRPDNSFDGQHPSGGMIVGADGNLYGTTASGGDYGLGTVFKLTRPGAGGTAWTESTLHVFSGSTINGDGAYPKTGLVQDKKGELYGVTYQGGNLTNPFGLTYPGSGTIFSLTQAGGAWTESIIWRFSGADGAYPTTRPLVVSSPSGTTLFGTTDFDTTHGGGTAYEATP